jgi:hypothetical protein
MDGLIVPDILYERRRGQLRRRRHIDSPSRNASDTVALNL